MGLLLAAEPLFIYGGVYSAGCLCVGIFVGLVVARRLANEDSNAEAQRVLNLLCNLFEWTNGMANEMAEYRAVMNGLSEKIHNACGDEDFAQHCGSNGLFSQIIAANQKLKDRLDSAEATLKVQSDAIASYVTEARTDPLTRLPNRRVFDDELSRRFAEFRRHGLHLSVMLVDVDHFKSFNDRYGHLAGDKVLADVARVLRDSMRESDVVARYGGEEFALILPASDLQDASLAAERVRLAIEMTAVHYEGMKLGVTASCGVATAEMDDNPFSLVKRADIAMYASKESGRNCCTAHDGHRCRAITGCCELNAARQDSQVPEDVVAVPVDSEDSDGGEAGGFQRLCEDLRRKLLEITDSSPV